MRRAVFAVIVTVLGLGALTSFRSAAPVVPKSVAANLAPSTTAPVAGAPPASTGGTTPSTNSTTRTATGAVVDNRYGPVQVQVTVQGSQIIAVDAVQLPSEKSRSASISDQAGPILQREALQAQSAKIDIVSGATYTSEGYAQSLQSALDAAHF